MVGQRHLFQQFFALFDDFTERLLTLRIILRRRQVTLDDFAQRLFTLLIILRRRQSVTPAC
jgi:hypothetical protein